MLVAEQGSGIVEWRRGLLVIYSTDSFAKKILPKYFSRNGKLKSFRRQLNYYGFIHCRSFSTTGSSTTALWVNRDLAKKGTDDISSVLQLKRVEPCETAKTPEGRRERKELAINTVEEDIGVSAKSLQVEQIRSMALRSEEDGFLQEESESSHYDYDNSSIRQEDTPFSSKVDFSRVSSVPAAIYPEEGRVDFEMSYEEQCVSAGAAHVLMMLSKGP
jgi:hypothetical protein